MDVASKPYKIPTTTQELYDSSLHNGILKFVLVAFA